MLIYNPAPLLLSSFSIPLLPPCICLQPHSSPRPPCSCPQPRPCSQVSAPSHRQAFRSLPSPLRVLPLSPVLSTPLSQLLSAVPVPSASPPPAAARPSAPLLSAAVAASPPLMSRATSPPAAAAGYFPVPEPTTARTMVAPCSPSPSVVRGAVGLLPGPMAGTATAAAASPAAVMLDRPGC